MRTKKDQSITKTDRALDPFADPVGYLRALGLEAELVESVEADLPTAA